MIELVNKEKFIEFATFKPKLKVTLLLDFEAVFDGKAIDPNFYENIGKEFASIIEKSALE